MNFPPIIAGTPSVAQLSAEARAHPVFLVPSTWRVGHTLYVKRLNGPIDRPPTLQERWMLADLRVWGENTAAAVEKPYHSANRRYLVSWSLEALQAGRGEMARRRTL